MTMPRVPAWCAAVATTLVLAWAGSLAFSQAVRPAANGPAPPRHAVTTDSTPFARILVGNWTYRSFRNDPNLALEFNALRFGAGVLRVESIADGTFRGTLDFGPEYQLALKGSITYGEPPTLRFQGVGTTSGSSDWVYDYSAQLVLDWPHGVDQRPAIVGSVIRSRPHSGGQAPAGVVASWIAVRQDDAPVARAPLSASRRAARAAAAEGLRADWRRFSEQDLKARAVPPPRREPPPAPERRALALAATSSFHDPEVILSQDGELRATLVVMKALNRIGNDPVHLRSYNGRLVGPTLRARPGDKLRITLRNDLEPEPDTGAHNTLHGFNTTNLHTHGLHVSPSGRSDNVLLAIQPGESLAYEIDIPRDHPAGTFWYHAHRHRSVAAQVSSGMAGALLVAGGLDEVPEIAAARERVFMLQQIPYYNKDLPHGVIEEEYVREIFGPGTWDALGRFTTVNGVQLPVIRMRPRAVERWRLIHAGVRETIRLKLEPAETGSPAAASHVPLHEIAVDGLPLGTLQPRDTVELWPGYRSDVLVQAPETPAKYLLVDERKSPQDSLTGLGENRKYIALLIVEGESAAMRLPRPEQLRPYRLPSLRPEQVTGTQEAKYAITRPAVEFTINGRPYDPATPRVLPLGAVEEWKVWSDPNPVTAIPVPHPFHIHVNPFEIFSMTDDQGRETLTEPVWRDTVILRPGWMVKFRTRYDTFTGDFVQHCHILDHEDQGMMELVRIAGPGQRASTGPASGGQAHVARAAPGPNAPVRGVGKRPEEFLGQPLVLVFSRGASCPHCLEQAKAFGAQEALFRRKGVAVLFVTPDAAGAWPIPRETGTFHLLADPELATFRRYGCYRDEPLHGIVLLDRTGKERWRTVGPTPFLDLTTVVREVERQTPRVEIEVRETADGRDDYVTWAPARCRIRAVPDAGLSDDLRVVLTNDPPQPAPPGRTLPLDGDLLFARELKPGQTATEETLSLVLPRDGRWQSFFVAGKHPQASTRDKDAVIEVHQDDRSGPVLATHPLMVRVRKEVRTLTAGEKAEFLKALHDVHMRRDRYEWFVRMHALASHGDQVVDWPDQAHGGSGFLPWHRAFLLQFERELQKTHPHVTLPYWRQYEPAPLFAADYLGTNRYGTECSQELVVFAPDNLLYGWQIRFNNLGFLRRAATDHTDPASSPRRFRTEQEVLEPGLYAEFHPGLERNPHNLGHLWVGGFNPGDPGWMRDCQKSPADPVFWVFHCEHDHLWAKWQWVYHRFQTDGQDPASYWPTAAYRLNDPDGARGHHLPDPMWPWDGTAGPNPLFPGDFNASRPRENHFGPFPASGVAALWPAQDASPTPADMIDYLGLDAARLEHGVCYDDTPYGVLDPTPTPSPARPAPAVLAERRTRARQAARFALDVLTDDRAAAANRLRAADTPSLATLEGAGPRLQRLVQEPATPAVLRARALGLLAEAQPDLAAREAARLLTAPDTGETLAVAAVDTISDLVRFGQVTGSRRKELHHALQEVAQKEARGPVLAAALAELVPMGDPVATQRVRDFLEAPATSPLALVRLVSLYARSQAADRAPVLRRYLASPATEVRVAALLALSGDAPSEAERLRLVQDRTQLRPVRTAALQSLMHDSARLLDALPALLGDASEDPQVRTEAAAAVRVAAVAQRGRLPAPKLEQLRGIVEAASKDADPELRRALQTTADVLRQVSQPN